MTDQTITQIIDDVIAAEGGYSNDPVDAGGETMYGITVAVARANGYHGQMSALPRSLAVRIYSTRYVFEPKFDRVGEVAGSRISAELIDTGVNMGPAIAAKFLQTSLNALNEGQADLVVDGQIGAKTLLQLEAYIAKRGTQGVEVLLRCLNGLQLARYIELSQSRPANKRFLFGWVAKRVVI
ncbi:N-acetylmuramidase [Pseudomonas sp. SO81]|uniref:glycoside hydrolase family 108 protein n=1 Tax=Pseudomonas sp. SO81 TaxID=2983246 RepID=UPI0025A388BC|nr:N-acetylmuramidase [Pseudomonas sp. SO81]WJN61345.1 Phage protein [Pseudomonas sp. SO81]